MKALIVIAILVGLYLLAKQFVTKYQTIKKSGQETAQTTGSTASASGVLPGLPPALEASLQTAQKQGPAALKTWLEQYRKYVADPRLGDIELDYVVMISRQDTVEARRLFQAVKGRTPATSPLYERVKRLEKTYQ